MSEHMNRLKDQMHLPHQHRSSRCLGRPLGQRSDCTSSLVKFFSIMNQSIKPKKVVSVTLSMKQLCPRKISLLELNFLSGYVARALSGCGHCWARGFKQLLRILHLAVSMLGKSASKTTLRRSSPSPDHLQGQELWHEGARVLAALGLWILRLC